MRTSWIGTVLFSDARILSHCHSPSRPRPPQGADFRDTRNSESMINVTQIKSSSERFVQDLRHLAQNLLPGQSGN